MIYDRSREYNIEIESYIFRGDVEVPLNILAECYSGSHGDDDPPEFIVTEAIVAEDNEPFKKGDRLKLTLEEENSIGERYFKTL